MARNFKKNFECMGHSDSFGRNIDGDFRERKYICQHKSTGRWCLIERRFQAGKQFEEFSWITFDKAKELAKSGIFHK